MNKLYVFNHVIVISFKLDHIHAHAKRPPELLFTKDENKVWKGIISKLNDRIRYARRVFKSQSDSTAATPQED